MGARRGPGGPRWTGRPGPARPRFRLLPAGAVRADTLITRRDYLRILVTVSAGLAAGAAGVAIGLFRRHGSGTATEAKVADQLEPGQAVAFRYPGEDDRPGHPTPPTASRSAGRPSAPTWPAPCCGAPRTATWSAPATTASSTRPPARSAGLHPALSPGSACARTRRRHLGRRDRLMATRDPGDPAPAPPRTRVSLASRPPAGRPGAPCTRASRRAGPRRRPRPTPTGPGAGPTGATPASTTAGSAAATRGPGHGPRPAGAFQRPRAWRRGRPRARPGMSMLNARIAIVATIVVGQPWGRWSPSTPGSTYRTGQVWLLLGFSCSRWPAVAVWLAAPRDR